MNERNDTPPRDPLAEAWRRASAVDGDAPSTRVRSAILAEARAQADAQRRSTVRGRKASSPAMWRMAATLSGVGLAAVMALIVWRGQPRPLPEPVPRNEQPAAGVARDGSDAAAAAPGATEPASEPATAPAPAVAPALAPAPARARPSLSERASVAPSSPAPQAPAAQALAPRAAAAPSLKAAAPPAAESRAEAFRADTESRRMADAPDRLLQQYFSDELARADARDWQYWLVLDPTGRVLRQGMRRVDASPPLEAWLQQAVPESRGARVDRQRIDDGRGGAVELLVLRTGTGTAP